MAANMSTLTTPSGEGRSNGLISRQERSGGSMSHVDSTAPKYPYEQKKSVKTQDHYCGFCSFSGKGAQTCEYCNPSDSWHCRPHLGHDDPRSDSKDAEKSKPSLPVKGKPISSAKNYQVGEREGSEEPPEEPKIERIPKALTQFKPAINEGYSLADDAELTFSSKRASPRGPIGCDGTPDRKEVADLICSGIIRRGDDEGEDIGMNCLPAPETPYTLRYRTKGSRRKASSGPSLEDSYFWDCDGASFSGDDDELAALCMAWSEISSMHDGVSVSNSSWVDID